jgi:hypothetical protein
LLTLPTTISSASLFFIPTQKHLLPSCDGHNIGNETRIAIGEKREIHKTKRERSTMEGDERSCILKKADQEGQTFGSLVRFFTPAHLLYFPVPLSSALLI